MQIGDAHGHIGQDHQGDDKGQKGAEQTGRGYHDAAEPHGQKLPEQDSDHDGDDELGQQAEPGLFLFHGHKDLQFLLSWAAWGRRVPIVVHFAPESKPYSGIPAENVKRDGPEDRPAFAAV